MEINEVLKTIESERKWFACISEKEERRLLMQRKRIRDGTAKISTIKSFFKKFGYDVKMVVEKIQ